MRTSVLLLLTVLPLLLEASDVRYVEETAEDRAVYRKYIDMDRQLKSLVQHGVKILLPYITSGVGGLNISSECMGNAMRIFGGVRRLELWALSFIDASGKLPSGIINGNIHSIGDYDECLKAKYVRKTGDVEFRGKYCLVNYRPFLPKKKRPLTFDGGLEELVEATKNTSNLIRYIVGNAQKFYMGSSKLGICVPSGCNDEETERIVKILAEIAYLNATIEHCDFEGKFFFLTPGRIFVISLFSLFGIMMLLGTFLDLRYRENGIKPSNLFFRIILCFSVVTNFPKFMNTKVSPDNHLSFMNGIRVLSVFYIVLLHQYFFQALFQLSEHMTNMETYFRGFFMQILINGMITCDVFFLISGVLNAYIRTKESKFKKRNLGTLQIIFHRLYRVYPTYLFTFMLMFVIKASGPMVLFAKKMYLDSCQKNWWQNILFINNFFDPETQCLAHSWYLACDTQLFLLSLITVPFLLKNAKTGIIINVSLIFCFAVFNTVFSYMKELTPGFIMYRLSKEEFTDYLSFYQTPYNHIPSYFTGIVLGYILAEKPEIKIPRKIQYIGWLVSSVMFVSMLFMTAKWNDGGEYTIPEAAFYNGFSKLVYVLAVSWLILCCATGNGGVINYILSLPLWIPLSRISFMLYLISPLIQTFYFSNLKVLHDGAHMTTAWRYFGDLTISCLLAVVMTVVLESPFIALQKILMGRVSPKGEEVPAPDVVSKSEKTVENCGKNATDIVILANLNERDSAQ